ncbi:outer membrane protein assembly factor [Halioglobus maricola]|uniref:Translocation and assembly module subunit TamA n=1 Tax=Halioglobus maricola TaxID=2601894 RepID=A0A5P9NLT3_9GAMM|nr:autotransporter assembly complex family protein [Halioglobus maricola]QFU76214.1 outer membrane protein assembly factor [Halioglobus maricola]
MNTRIPHALIALLVFVLPAWSAQAQTLQLELSGISGDVRDNTQAWLGDLPDTAQSRTNYLFSARNNVLKSLQALGYYNADVTLELDRDANPWLLRINVDPGERARMRRVDIRLVGGAEEDEAFTKLILEHGLQVDQPFDHAAYQSFKSKLSALGLRRGYFDGEYTRSEVQIEPEGNTADVFLHYASGERYRFGSTVYDQDFLRESLLQPLLEAKEGEPYDQALLQKTQANLQRTRYFSTVVLRPDREQAQNQVVPLNLSLYPARTHSIDLGVGFSTDTRERVSVTWRTPRLNSLGHSQETRLMYSPVNPSGRFTYTIPLGHPNNDVLQMSARLEDNEFGDLDSNQEELAVRREIKRDSWVYSYGLRRLNEGWDAEGIRRENDYLLPGFSLSQRRRTGDPLNPSGAFSHWYRIEAGSAELASDVDVVRMAANFGHVRSSGERHRMVFKSELGLAFISDSDRDQLAPSLNFFAGGAQSIRGYSYQSIGNEVTVEDDNSDEVSLVVGGDRLLTVSAEYQYLVRENWRAAVFVDAGDAFDEGDFDANVGVGVGVHYITPVGAVRLDLANPVTDDDPSWRVHFSIGAEF